MLVQFDGIAPRVVHEGLLATGTAGRRVAHREPLGSERAHDVAQVVVEQGEVLAHVVRGRQLNEVDLLAAGVEPGAGDAEVGPVVALGQAQDLGVEGEGRRHVGDVEGDVVDPAGRGRHGNDPTTWRTMAATEGAASALTWVISVEVPAAALVTTASPKTAAPACRAAMVSMAMDMPTTSATIWRSMGTYDFV